MRKLVELLKSTGHTVEMWVDPEGPSRERFIVQVHDTRTEEAQNYYGRTLTQAINLAWGNRPS